MKYSINLKPEDRRVLSSAHRKLEKELRRWPVLLWLCALPLMILGVLLAYVYLVNYVFLADGELVRDTDKLVYWQGQPILVNLTPTLAELGRSNAAMPAVADVIVALDVSGSMGSADRAGDPSYEAIGVIRKISNLLYGANANIGFVSFDDQATLEVGLGDTKLALHQSLSALESGGGTDIAQALSLSLDEFANSSLRASKLLVLVTDGKANANNIRQLARQAKSQNVHIIGIGIGPQAIDFFDTALDLGNDLNLSNDVDLDNDLAPFHFALEWAGNDDEIFQGLQHILVQGKLGILTSIGESPRLAEYPHLGSLPIVHEIPTEVRLKMGIESQRLLGSELQFSSFYFLNTPHFYSYVLKANALGVHPIALDQATLSYRQASADGGATIEQFSGGSPRVLVLSPLLLLLMYLPALLYAAYLFTQRKYSTTLMLPSALPKLAVRSTAKPLPTHQFQFRSLRLKKPSINEQHIPTLIISVGAASGERLAALLRAVENTGHRVNHQGAYCVDDDIYPMHLDCTVLGQDKLPMYRDWRLDGGNAWELYDHSRPELLSNLLTELRDKPSQHSAADWFDSDAFAANNPDIANGCGGNRPLARLLVYLDLLKPKPVMHSLCADVVQWVGNFPQGQIFMLSAPEEDIGSVWPIDIACHIRGALGQKAVPIYLFQGESTAQINKDNDLRILNAQAHRVELGVMQNAAGLPVNGMGLTKDKTMNSTHFDSAFAAQFSSVLLPLFDRVFCIKHNGQAADSALSAQMLVEMMDASVKQTMTETLAGTAWRYRSGRYRSQASQMNVASGIISHIDASVFHVPIVLWRKLWNLYAIRDSLTVLLNLDFQHSDITLKEEGKYAGYEADLWQEVASSSLSRPLSCMKTLNNLNESLRALGGFHPSLGREKDSSFNATPKVKDHANTDAFGREMMLLLSAYLNGNNFPSDVTHVGAWVADRQQRFAKALCLLMFWKDGLEKSQANETQPEHPMHRVLHLGISNGLENLQYWAQALFDNKRGDTGHTVGLPLLTKVTSEIEALHNQLQMPQIDNGVVSPPLEHWRYKPDQLYQQSMVKKLVGQAQLLALFNWTIDPSNTQLELQLSQQRYGLADIGDGKLQRDCYEILESTLLSEYFTWTIDDCLAPEHFPRHLDIDAQGHIFVFHGCQSYENASVVQDNTAFINAHTSMHGYHDRIVAFSLQENVFDFEPSIVGPNADTLPLVQPFALNVRTLDASLRGLTNESLPVDSLPERQLFAQDMATIKTALMVWLGGHLQRVKIRNVSQWVLQQNEQMLEVTAIGDASKTQAMKQIFFIGHCLNGLAIDLDFMKDVWGGLSYQDRHAKIHAFIDEFEQQCTQEDKQSGWPYLLLAKARIDACSNSGLLA